MEFRDWFNSQFPESLYPPIINKELYLSRVKSGGDIASFSNIGIIGLTRNSEKIIRTTLNRIHYLSKFFKSVKVLIFENDSIDSTNEIVTNFIDKVDNLEIHLASKNLDTKYHEGGKEEVRRKDMSFYRNTCLSIINRMEWDIEHLIILDTDLYGGFSYEGIFNSLGFEDEWSAIGSNSLLYNELEDKTLERLFYDTWAYRPIDSWNDCCGEKTNRLIFERGQEPIKVNSCFGGMCIYKYEDIKGLSYDDSDCDHVTLHKKLKAKGKGIYLNPSQITLYNNHIYC